MRVQTRLIPVAALTIALSGVTAVAQAQDRGARDEGQGRGESHERARGSRERDGGIGGGGRAVPREQPREEPRQAPRYEQRDNRQDDRRESRRDERADRRDDRRDGRYDGRYDGRDYRRDNRRDRRDDYRYGPPRVIVPGPRVIVPRDRRHYYGPGGNFSVYFGWGSGYRFGNWYDGRVYGYVAPGAYGMRRYYGDVRLQVRPRNAEVYVDGYYAGIVDNFDGVFQRLTLEVGEHEIEIAAPGFEPQFYRIYVDPARTVDVRSDLLPGGYSNGGYPGNYPPPYPDPRY